MKYVLMSKEEERRFINECINSKPSYSDSELAFGLALYACKKIKK